MVLGWFRNPLVKPFAVSLVAAGVSRNEVYSELSSTQAGGQQGQKM